MTDPATTDPGPAPPRPAGRLIPRAVSAHAPAPAKPGQAIVWALLGALYRRRRQAVLFGLPAAAALAAAVWFLLPPPLPSAAAKLYVPIKPATVLGEHPDPPLERATQIALIRSRLVLAVAIRDEPVKSLPVLQKQTAQGTDPVDWLAKTVVADFSEGSEILRISLSCDDGDQAKVLVDAIKDAYLREIVNRSTQQRKDRLNQLNAMASTTEDSLKRKRKTARDTGENAGSDAQSLALQRKLTIEQAGLAQSELLKTRADLRRLTSEEAALKGRAGGAINLPDTVLDGYVLDDPLVRESLAQRANLEHKLKDYEAKAVDLDRNEAYLALKAQLAAHNKAHETLRAQVRARVLEGMRTKSASELAYHQETLRRQIEYATEFEKILTTEVEKLGEVVNRINTTTHDLAPIQLEIKQTEELLTKINATVTNLRVEQDVPPRVLELEKAAVIPVDETRRKMIFAALAALAGLAGVGGLIGFLELRLRRVESSDGVVHGLGLPVVGVIPRIPARRARGYGKVDGSGWQAGLTEAINCTRTVLLHGEGLAAPRVILITSPVSGEGKTTFSTHLALSLALAGRRTLLIDGDLRNPNAHRLFAVPSGPGFCEILRGEAGPAEVTQPTAVANLSLIPAGRWTDGTQQALAAGGLDDVFAGLRTQFDVIVLDSSPVLPVTDPLLLARHADGVIVALMQGVSRLPLADEAYHRLAVLGVRVLGAVISGTPHRNYGYGYSYADPPAAAAGHPVSEGNQ